MGDDLLILRNGKMLILRNHEMIDLQEEMRLIDGTRTPALACGASVALDGRVITADGTSQALVEGQAILVDSRGLAA
jgi:hypothetical protein